MARGRYILALIVVLWSFLFVTAFRLGGLSSDEQRHRSVRGNPLLVCDQCSEDDIENKSGERIHVAASAVKNIANRRSYEDVKKAVQEEQKRILDKKARTKTVRAPKTFMSLSDDDDDDEDDREESIAYRNIKRIKETSKQTDAKNGVKAYSKTNSYKKSQEGEIGLKGQKNIGKEDSRNKVYEKQTVQFVADDETDEASDEEEDEIDSSDDEKDNDTDEISDEDDLSNKEEDESGSDQDNKDSEDNDDNDSDEDSDDDEDDSDDQDEKNIIKFKTHKAVNDDANSDNENTDEIKGVSDNESTDTDGDDGSDNDDDDDDSYDEDDEDDAEDDDDDDDTSEKQIFQKVNIKNNKPLLKTLQPSNSFQAPKTHIVDYIKTNLRPAKKMPTKPLADPYEKKKDNIMIVVTDNKKDVDKKLVTQAKTENKKEPSKKKPEASVKPKVSRNLPVQSSESKILPKTQINLVKQDKRVEAKSHHKPGDYSEVLKNIHGDPEKKIIKRSAKKSDQGNVSIKQQQHERFEGFYSFLPTFAPDFSRVRNVDCRRHGLILLRQLRGYKLWALKMLDATGKIPSGILRGNGNQLGNFDQCLASHARVRIENEEIVKVHGKYCLADVELKAIDDRMQIPVHLAQARNLIKSRIGDPGHFVPKFSTLHWGLCLPASCDADDAEQILGDALRLYNGTTGLKIIVQVDPINCQSDDDDWWERWFEIPTLITLSLYFGILAIVIYATFKDYLRRRKSISENEDHEADTETNEEEILKEEGSSSEEAPKTNGGCGIIDSFSLYKTMTKLFKDECDEGEIKCIHGIRAVCSIALLLAHKTISLAMTPYTNRIELTELSTNPLSLFLRNSLVYTDTFLLLSGTLSAYHLAKDYADSGSVPWQKRYFSRYVRLTPALAATVLFYAFIWEKIGSGPQWGNLVKRNAELCQEGFLSNLLYIQNFFNFDEMCAPHTHQLALDMQLTLLSGVFVWLALAKPFVAAGFAASSHLLVIYLRHSTTLDHRLTMIIFHGATSSQLHRTASLSYTNAIHRLTPYLAGLMLGVLLQRSREKSKLPKWILFIGWLLTGACSGWFLYIGWEACDPQYDYDVQYSAIVAGLLSPACAVVASWIILVCYMGNAEWLDSLLSSKLLLFISRTSYALYLCQFIVFFTNVASTQSAEDLNVFKLININELSTIFLVSIIMTVTLVIPMQSLPKYLLERSNSADSSNKESESRKQSVQGEEQLVDDENNEVQPEVEFPPENEECDNNDDPKLFLAHRELLEEILEAELEFEYEAQRDRREEDLEEILEEEEDDLDIIDQMEVEGQSEGDMEIIPPIQEEEEDEGVAEEDEGVEEEDEGVEGVEGEVDDEAEDEQEKDGNGGEEEIDDIWADRDEDDLSLLRRYSTTWDMDHNDEEPYDMDPAENSSSWARYRYSR